jgi:hypothetical protein
MVDKHPTHDPQSDNEMPQNKVTYVLRIQDGQAANSSQNTTIKTSIAHKVSYQALILL